MGLTMLLRAVFAGGRLTRAVRAGTVLAEALRPNATRQLDLGHDAFIAAQSAHAAEYRHARGGRFDALVNGLNRLPRPMLALGTLGLFVYAMADPEGFARRMTGLASVPEPLWWLLGAVVAFYFGARETHYLREHRAVAPSPRSGEAAAADSGVAPGVAPGDVPRGDNAALRDWRASLPQQIREGR
ncbi:MAG: holin family protein [Pararhodobacter sp.]